MNSLYNVIKAARRRCWLSGLLLGWGSLTAGFGQVGFQVSPSKIYVKAGGPGEQSVQVHLKNTMDTPLTLQASCVDWRRDSTGNKVYYPSGTLPASCCPFVSATPALIELAPREERDIFVTVRTGAMTATESIRNGMLFLTQVNDPRVPRPVMTQIAIKVQIGIMVYVLPPDSRQAAIAITDMRVARAADQQLVRVQLHNKGGTLLESQLRLEYLNLSTMEELKTEPVPVNTMPNDLFRVSAVVPAILPAGKYLIVAILDSGPGQAMKVAELEAAINR